MEPVFCEEFRRWRDAPADDKHRVARHQVSTRTTKELFPEIKDAADVGLVLGPSGKRLGDCTSEEFFVMACWYRALLSAMREKAAGLALRNRVGHVAI